ncbi:DEHA2E00572p [Debaryomyces hansenii CBS767]|uniref:DEHA2E00572p n=1 Tax=Debaryomyces hansenii (strain ATCC 36239 / CBS 767 / BCRC 21394 / JCM 1990 / NBRC 0083 / IGC 2968) TaxID=284592 RepID=Q6BR17_DEBHA|nr:DEHA2E00572p [Debaryomyces hansenii CBS767]CAG87536.2 DEHA2E00572p [Debaryomyces hansenii CBS767]|eukprot:XP_459353.2 DEHA2E00572p [Debaryomyces hansenii CBS767]
MHSSLKELVSSYFIIFSNSSLDCKIALAFYERKNIVSEEFENIYQRPSVSSTGCSKVFSALKES